MSRVIGSFNFGAVIVWFAAIAALMLFGTPPWMTDRQAWVFVICNCTCFAVQVMWGLGCAIIDRLKALGDVPSPTHPQCRNYRLVYGNNLRCIRVAGHDDLCVFNLRGIQ